MDTFLQDVRYGVRMLWSRPTISLIAVVSLALGIGFNTTIFTMIRAVFLAPIPVEDSSSLVAWARACWRSSACSRCCSPR